MKLRWLAFLLIALPCSAQTWSTWNGKTIGASTGNITTMNGKAVGTSTGNYSKWNNLASPGGGGAAHTFSSFHTTDQGGTCSGTTCSITVPSTVAGSPMMIFTYNASGHTISSVSGCGTWVTGTTSSFTQSNASASMSAAYNVNLTGSCTSISVTINSTDSGWDIVAETALASPSSGVVLDQLGNNANTTSCTACSASSFTGLTGSGDLLIQGIDSSASFTGVTVSSPYAWDANDDGIYAMNTTSATSPTITFGGAGAFMSIGYAFK